MKRLRFQAAYYFYSGKDEASVAAVMEGADVVINMVGKRYETKHLLPFDKNGKMDIWKGTRVNCRCSSSCRAPAHCHPPRPPLLPPTWPCPFLPVETSCRRWP